MHRSIQWIVAIACVFLLAGNLPAQGYQDDDWVSDEEWYRGFKVDEWNLFGVSPLIPDIPTGVSFSRTYPDGIGWYGALRMMPVRPGV
ncbi:hypothetical protein GF324_10190, partial [bacterium]|nr:hypothetical protein [bacterium]